MSPVSPCCSLLNGPLFSKPHVGVGTLDPANRRAIYVKAQALLANEVPMIFLC
jgi:hypothetical protein